MSEKISVKFYLFAVVLSLSVVCAQAQYSALGFSDSQTSRLVDKQKSQNELQNKKGDKTGQFYEVSDCDCCKKQLAEKKGTLTNMPEDIKAVQNEIVQLVKERSAALVRGDISYFEKLISENFNYISSAGVISNRQEYVKRLSAGEMLFSAAECFRHPCLAERKHCDCNFYFGR